MMSFKIFSKDYLLKNHILIITIALGLATLLTIFNQYANSRVSYFERELSVRQSYLNNLLLSIVDSDQQAGQFELLLFKYELMNFLPTGMVFKNRNILTENLHPVIIEINKQFDNGEITGSQFLMKKKDFFYSE